MNPGQTFLGIEDKMSSKKVTIDRLEGSKAVLVDDKNQLEIPVSWLPEGCKEGTQLTLTITSDPAGTQALTDRVATLQSRFTKPARKP
jgi:hypothetical protein